MTIMIVGSGGQLGRALLEGKPKSAEVFAVDFPDLDITCLPAVQEIVAAVKPSVIVNAAAYTAVDLAESEADKAFAVNVEGPRNIARATRKHPATLIHISTDFVFDGESNTPYPENAATNPLSVYGTTKRDGEIVLLNTIPSSAVIVRTAWLYSATGQNFVTTMLRLLAERDEVQVVADQTGCPTSANSLAFAIWKMIEKRMPPGVYHWTDDGTATWHEFACAIQKIASSLGLLDRTIPIRAITTDKYPAAAIRPKYSALDSSIARAMLELQPQHWRVNLQNLIEGMKT